MQVQVQVQVKQVKQAELVEQVERAKQAELAGEVKQEVLVLPTIH